MAKRSSETSMEHLYHQHLNRLILEIHGFIVPTELLKPARNMKPANASTPPFEYSVEQLREQWIEAMMEQGVGRNEAMMAKPGMTRADIARERAHRPRAPGKYYPVSRAEVEAARKAMLKSGVTFFAYMRWHLLRRNYEADPTVLQKGPWRQVVRAPLPSMRFGLSMLLLKPGASLASIAKSLDELGDLRTPWQIHVRHEIDVILADINRPLRPRRTELRTTHTGKSD